MPGIKGTSRAQTRFLRSFRKSPSGPAPQDWPSITLLRRWLRKPAFKAALDSLREALRFHADFQLTIGASQAAQTLGSGQHSALPPQDVKMLSDLLRHAHQRQRFPTETTHASPATFKLRDQMKELEQSLQILREERSLKSSSKRKPADQAEDDAWERDMSEELQSLKALVNPAHPAS